MGRNFFTNKQTYHLQKTTLKKKNYLLIFVNEKGKHYFQMKWLKTVNHRQDFKFQTQHISLHTHYTSVQYNLQRVPSSLYREAPASFTTQTHQLGTFHVTRVVPTTGLQLLYKLQIMIVKDVFSLFECVSIAYNVRPV